MTAGLAPSHPVENIRDALKAATAVLVSLAIAWSLGWDEPVWAGISALVVHLGSYGASTLKGLNRVVGTLVSALAAIAVLALFSQSRWGFMAGMSVWLVVTGYMCFTSKHAYMWMKMLVVSILFVAHSQLNSLDSFNIIVARTQTTVIGVIVHYLVDTFVWPTSSRPAMIASLLDVVTLQNEITRDFFTPDFGVRLKDGRSGRPRLFMKGVTKACSLIELCLVEDARTLAERHAWRHVIATARRLVEVQGHIAHAIRAYPAANPLLTQFEGADEFLDAMNERAARLEQLLGREQDKESPSFALRRVTLALADPSMRGICGARRDPSVQDKSGEQREALAVLASSMSELEELSATLTSTLEAIFSDQSALPAKSPPRAEPLAIDPEAVRLTACLLAMFVFSYLLYIYTLVPGGMEWVYITMLFTLQTVLAPRERVQSIIVPFSFGSLTAAVQYVFIFPHITEFYQLALYMTAAFCLFWVFFKRSTGKWACVLLLLYCGTAFDSPPSYGIMNILDMAIDLFLFMVSCYLITGFIYPMRPESVFLHVSGWFRQAAAARVRLMAAKDFGSRLRHAPSLLSAMSPLVLAGRLEAAAGRFRKDDHALNEYVDSAYYLAFHIASLRTAHEKMRDNPALKGFLEKAGGHLGRLSELMAQAKHDSLDDVSEKAGRAVLALAADTARLPGAREDGQSLLKHHEAYGFKQSFEIVAHSVVDTKAAYGRLDVEGLTESRF
jgi:uncharacterized membrane protein YccC